MFLQEQRKPLEILRFLKIFLFLMKDDIIAFIDVTYAEIALMPIEDLDKKIAHNIEAYLDKIDCLSEDEKISMREKVKDTRKMKFRFSQEITQDIPKDRIQIALSQLAKLFRALNNDIKKDEK